jgi:hypothetical protein
MGRKHIYYFLKNEEGEPIEGAEISLKLTGTLQNATIYANQTVSAGINPSGGLVTNSDGFFDFWIGDQFETTYVGYEPSQYFDLYWASPSGTGLVDRVQFFDFLYPVDETDTTSVTKNKMMNNTLAYNFERHVDMLYTGTPHSIYPVDETDSTDGTLNKVVSNELLNRLYGFSLTSGAKPGLTIAASGALITTHTLYASAMSASGDYWQSTFDPELNKSDGNHLPITQIYTVSGGNVILPWEVKINSATEMKIITTRKGDYRVTTVAEQGT